MSFRLEIIDAIIDGKIGKGIVVTRKEVMNYFSEKYKKNYTGCALSNAEMETSDHSPTYIKFTLRVEEGIYRIHPKVIVDRMMERNLIKS